MPKIEADVSDYQGLTLDMNQEEERYGVGEDEWEALPGQLYNWEDLP